MAEAMLRRKSSAASRKTTESTTPTAAAEESGSDTDYNYKIPVKLLLRLSAARRLRVEPLRNIPVSVGDVRAIIATALRVRPRQVSMSVWTAVTTKGAAFVQVCDEDDAYEEQPWDARRFADERGRMRGSMEIGPPSITPLWFDDERFLMAGERRVVIYVTIQIQELKPCQLYLRSGLHHGHSIVPLLPDPVPSRTLRDAVARRAHISRRDINVWRQTGLTKENGFLAVEVFDSDTTRKLTFSDPDGNLLSKDQLQAVEDDLLTDHDAPIMTTARPSVLYLVFKSHRSTHRVEWTPLYIHKMFASDGPPGIRINPHLLNPVSVGELRRVTASRLETDIDYIDIFLWEGVKDARRHILVIPLSGCFVQPTDPNAEYENCTGAIIKRKDLERLEIYQMNNDDGFLPTIKNRRIVIGVEIRRTPMEMVRLRLQPLDIDENGRNFNARMPAPVTIGAIRQHIGFVMGVKPSWLMLEQLCVCHSKRCFFHVCDEKGYFPGFRAYALEFADEEGITSHEDDGDRITNVLMNDNHPFHMSRGRRSVIRYRIDPGLEPNGQETNL